MKAFFCCAIALTLLPLAARSEDKTIDPVELTAASKPPALQLNDKQRALIEQALATENTEQKAPPNFYPKPGDPVPSTMTVAAMPQDLVAREPSLQPFGYAKLAKDVLVIDPMKKTIIAVLPRKDATSGKDLTPADWAATKGRELTGQTPDPAAAEDASAPSAQAPEPTGDSGDKKRDQNFNRK